MKRWKQNRPGRRKLPPKIKRYCPVCDKKTDFIFNPKINHSECSDCGGRVIK